MNKKNILVDEFSYDPVTAISESNAPKEIAIIFKDIKKTMGIPIVTSIWRGLADMDDSLLNVWNLTKPIFNNGEPEFIYNKLFEHISLPSPPKITSDTLERMGINNKELKNIKNIVSVYNRSNTMNLIALSALVNVNFSYISSSKNYKTSSINYQLPALLERHEINNNTWKIVKNINAYGTTNGSRAHVATLWRHLSYWPKLLDFADLQFRPMRDNGQIEQALETVLNYVLINKIILKEDTKSHHQLNKLTVSTITNYVHSKHQVVRMVTLGNILQKWLFKK